MAIPASSSGAGWYVVWYHPVADIKDAQQTWYIGHFSTPPAEGSLFHDGIVVQLEGPYATKAAASNAIGVTNGATTGKGGGPNGPNTTNPQANKSAQLPDIFHGLNLGEILLRLGEVVLGVVLIGVGVAHITGAQNTISKAAKVAGTAALL